MMITFFTEVNHIITRIGFGGMLYCKYIKELRTNMDSLFRLLYNGGL